MALHSTMCLRLEDGNSPTRGRCNRGEESQSDPQVSTEHIVLHRSASLWHAGTAESLLLFAGCMQDLGPVYQYMLSYKGGCKTINKVIYCDLSLK